MTWRAAIWTLALAVSLAVHAMMALAVSGLRGAAPGVALAELRIADDAGFAVTVVRPVTQRVAPAARPPEADTQSADAIKPVAPMVLAPAASTAAGYGAATQHDEIAVAAVAAEQLKAAGPERPISPVASDGTILPAAPGANLADSVPAAATVLEPVSPQTAAASSAGAVEPPVPEKRVATAEEPVAAVAAEHLKAAGPEKPLSPVASAGVLLPAAQEESVADTVPGTNTALEPVSPQTAAVSSSAAAVESPVVEPQAAAEEVPTAAAPAVKPVPFETPALSEISQPSTVPSIALPEVAAQKLAPIPQQVALAPAVLAPASLAERMRDFVRFYDGGSCFFAVPVSFDGQRPRIDGFGSEAGPILTFGAELRRALGIDAEIMVRQITGQQCPAIGFIGGLLKSRLPELLVQLENDLIASGKELRGTVEGVHLPWLSLFLVDDDGMVHDISTYLSKTQDGWLFSAPVYVTAQGRERNQLIVAIAASRALDRLNLTRPTAGSELFPAVVSEAGATQNDIAIGIGAFRVE